MLVTREYEEPFNKSPVIRAVSALLLVILSLTSLIRLSVRLVTVRYLKKDDILILLATSIIVILQGANGCGQPEENLDPGQVDSILKRQFASDVLYILALTLAKLSASRTISDLAAATRRPHIWAIEGVIAIWGITSTFIHGFQCGVSAPWDYLNGHCLDRAALWTYIDALNIITDIALTGILVELINGLKTKIWMKITITGLFSSRLLTIPPIAVHIFIFRNVANSTDPTFDMWKPIIVAQVILCISMVTTCIPFLKPFIDSLDSGGWVTGDLRQTQASASRSGSTGVLNYAKRKGGVEKSKGENSSSVHRRREYEVLETENNDVSLGSWRFGEGITTATASPNDNTTSWDRGSQNSQAVLVESSWTLEVERIEGERDAT